MKIWVLTENTACREDLGCEHGLSLYIETEKHTLLFDAGQGPLFAENARKLGLDLKRVDTAVLSHGHYDHGGGMPFFLSINETAPVYAARQALLPYYNAQNRYIGLPRQLTAYSPFRLLDYSIELDETLTLYTAEAVTDRHPIDSFGLQAECSGVLVPDDFLHEQYLLIRENGKRYLFTGCAHRGILNIAQSFRPDVLIGGFHLSKVPSDSPRLVKTAEALLALPTVYYTGHCTGTEQFGVLKQYMGERLQPLATGTVLTL